MRTKIFFSSLVVLLIILFVSSLVVGAVKIPLESIIDLLLGNEVKQSWKYIVTEFRFPKAIVAVLVGIALSISGMLMQTLFRNFMADSYVLGISSGSSLGVALIIMGSTFLPDSLQFLIKHPFAISISAIIGGFLVMNLVLLFSKRFTETNSLLVVGLMFSSFASSFVSIMAYFSTAEELQRFTFWNMGSLGNVSWNAIYIFIFCVVICTLMSFRLVKPLNALLLGENYAQTLGVSLTATRNIIIWITCVLCGVTTAFVGPIAFVGLAVPHISRMVLKTQNHFILLISNLLLGSVLLLLCDIISQVPGTSIILPINAITSIIGAPIVIYLIIRKK